MDNKKPLLIYDGDCNFCRRWIVRWRRWTGDRIAYASSQEVGAKFPNILPEEFQKSVQFVEPDGKVYRGAEAVFRTLAYAPGKGWTLWSYRRIPLIAPVTEGTYGFIASHRRLFSILTRWMWGDVSEPSEYVLARWMFLKFLGIIYLIAFASLWVQIDGLMGSNGVSPAADYLRAIAGHFGLSRYHLAPTLCWLDSSDSFLHFLCGGGAVLSLFLIAGALPGPILFCLWVFYLSLVTVGQDFLSFQWDNLLLETGFLAIFLAPAKLWSPWPVRERPPSAAILWALRILLFKLMFSSGFVKFLSGDAAWKSLTALNFHYQTQPLPTWIGWWAHQLPAGFQKLSVAVMFAIELGLPFLIFLPRRPRMAAFAGFTVLMLLIIFTGNYCFFNLLTMDLCVLLLDDTVWLRAAPKALTKSPSPFGGGQGEGKMFDGISPLISIFSRGEKGIGESQRTSPLLYSAPPWKSASLAAVAVFTAGVSVIQVSAMYLGRRGWVESLEESMEWVMPFRTTNHYGLFAVMTTSRMEIVIEGSQDGRNWLPYEFKWKPGDVNRPPAFVEPHQPRLDWQMWFAALGTYQQNPWFIQLLVRLLQGSAPVLALLKSNPFPSSPPRYIRGMAYDYRFTDIPAHRKTGAWWRREPLGQYCPTISLGQSNGS